MKNYLQKSISSLLDQHPLLNATQIEVVVTNDEVVLRGTADSFLKKALAGEIAEQNNNNKNVVNKIRVIHSGKFNDSDILSAITNCFQTNFGNSYLNIDVLVKDGFVKLDGQMKWKYQMQLATECIKEVPGIKHIVNNITVPPLKTDLTSEDILTALQPQMSISIDNIQVDVAGHKVILKGMVDSEEQKNQVVSIVRRIPGVLEIENSLCIN